MMKEEIMIHDHSGIVVMMMREVIIIESNMFSGVVDLHKKKAFFLLENLKVKLFCIRISECIYSFQIDLLPPLLKELKGNDDKYPKMDGLG